MKTVRRRRMENKTDYKLRMGFLKYGKPRIVVRKTNRYMVIQYVQSTEARDQVLIGLISKDLLKHGWPKELQGSLKSIPACYLAGYLAGKNILKEYPEAETILDIGLQRNVQGSRLYAVLKGLADAGLSISHNEKSFPIEERIEGKHLKSDIGAIIKKVKSNIK